MIFNLKLFLFLTVTLLSSYGEDLISSILNGFNEQPDQANIWAVLVAGSKYWYNYRHQADICRAYHLFVSRGVKRENIITMMYDDIANDTENLYPGKIFNEPFGPDVYEGVRIDYSGGDVNDDNFLAVITGNRSAVRGGNGRVLESNAADNVFINFVDHGADGFISFPSSILQADRLNNGILEMHAKGMYKSLVFYLEACESGSMFENILPKDIGVYAVTAANSTESSWGCYCDNEMGLPCLGDYFSVLWMEDSEVKDLTNETNHEQYEIVKAEVNTSHVTDFGDLSVANEKAASFQGPINYNQTKIENVGRKFGRLVSADDIYFHEILRQITRAPSAEMKHALKEKLAESIWKRRYFNHFMDDFIGSVAANGNGQLDLHKKNNQLIEDTDCYRTATDYFHNNCFNLGKNPYALRFMYIFKNMCNARIGEDTIIEIISKKCDANGIVTDIH